MTGGAEGDERRISCTLFENGAKEFGEDQAMLNNAIM